MVAFIEVDVGVLITYLQICFRVPSVVLILKFHFDPDLTMESHQYLNFVDVCSPYI